jgi:hypothetical protein
LSGSGPIAGRFFLIIITFGNNLLAAARYRSGHLAEGTACTAGVSPYSWEDQKNIKGLLRGKIPARYIGKKKENIHGIETISFQPAK